MTSDCDVDNTHTTVSTSCCQIPALTFRAPVGSTPWRVGCAGSTKGATRGVGMFYRIGVLFESDEVFVLMLNKSSKHKDIPLFRSKDSM